MRQHSAGIVILHGAEISYVRGHANVDGNHFLSRVRIHGDTPEDGEPATTVQLPRDPRENGPEGRQRKCRLRNKSEWFI